MRDRFLAQGVAAGFLFASSPLLIRLLPRLDAFSIGFYRLFLAGLIMAGVGLLLGWRMWNVGWREMILGALFGAHFAAFILSVKHTTVMNASVIVNTTPAFTALISWTLFGLRPSYRSVAGIVLGILGIAMLFSEGLRISGGFLGEAEALAGALFWAAYLNLGRVVRIRAGDLRSIPSIYLLSSMFLLALTLPGGGPMNPDAVELLILLAMAIIPTCLGHTLHFSSLKGLRPYQTSALALLEPVTASVLAIPLFNEIPTPLSILGAMVVLASIYIVASSER